jgi:hypothetical protein
MSETSGDGLDRVRGRTSSVLAGGTLVVIAALVVGLMIVPRFVLSPVGNGAAGGSQSAIPAVPTTAASFATLAPYSEAPTVWESGTPAPTPSGAPSLAATTQPRPLPTELPPTPEPLGTQGYDVVTINRWYTPLQVDATHISVTVDYEFHSSGTPSKLVKPLGFFAEDCTDHNFQALASEPLNSVLTRSRPSSRRLAHSRLPIRPA